ncbi:MAG TPA: hypothetical protein ENG66_06490 [Thermococcus sp.]|nr:MAG: hypothetical protein DRP04_10610 [Archaeoglobales archaeon]HDH45018.1 hypothetical protein [Thermococcus sp.]
MGVVLDAISINSWAKSRVGRKYYLIADREGFDEAFKELKRDYMLGILKYPTYKTIERKLLKLQKECESEKPEFKDMRDLLLRFLLYLAIKGKSKFTYDELVKVLGCDKETVKEFIDWVRKSEYYIIVKALLRKQETS